MFVVISGPMGSGKSYEIIKYAQGYIDQGREVVCVKPRMDTRNEGIWSRGGASLEALPVDTLEDIGPFDVYIIDEAHFFDPKEVKYIEKWLDTSDVIVSGLDVGHKRELMPFYTKLYELKPDLVIQKVAQCTICNKFNAQYTQILVEGEPYTGEFESAPVEDGTHEYQPRCRKCFVL